MVTPALKKQFEANNVEIIPLKEGAELVAELFCEHQGYAQILVGNWMQLPRKNFFAEGVQQQRLTKTIRLADNQFLLGHQIQQGRALGSWEHVDLGKLVRRPEL